MLAELRAFLDPRWLAIVGAVLLVTVLMAPWTPTYSPLRTAMVVRFLEREGRSEAQLAARRAADERAAEDERRRVEAARKEALQREREAAEKRSDEREWASLVAEYRTLDRPYGPPINQLLKNTNESANLIRARANDPAFYRGNVITPEDVSSRRPCTDPATTSDLFDRSARRDRNIFGCAVYLVIAPDAGPEARIATLSLVNRIGGHDKARSYPLPTLIAMIWLSQIRGKLQRGERPAELPDQIDGETVNPQLFGDTLAPGFARRFVDTATIEEKITLRGIYADLTRMTSIAQRIHQICRTIRDTDCLRRQEEGATAPR